MDCIDSLAIKYKDPVTAKDMAIQLHILMMIDIFMNWPELARLLDLTAKHAAIIFDKQWPCCYPHPLKVGHYKGT